MGKAKRSISLLLVTIFMIVMCHNILPAHHHDISVAGDAHEHAHHHDHGDDDHHHHHSSSSLWNLLLEVLEKIPHADTENQSQQTFVKQIQKQDIHLSDEIPMDFFISVAAFFDMANEAVLFHSFKPKDPVPIYIKNGIRLRAPPIFV